MKRFTLSVMITAVLGLAAYSFAGAQSHWQGLHGPGLGPAGFFQDRGGPGGPGRGPGGRGGGMMFGLRGLDLTDEQKTKIRAIHESERESRDGAPAVVQLRRELQIALYADVPDQEGIAALQQQLLQAQSALQARQVAIEQQIAQVLTAEQRAQVRERLAKGPRALASDR